jgi:hypothetical protein
MVIAVLRVGQDAVGEAARVNSPSRKRARLLSHRARSGHGIADGVLGVAFDQRPDRDSNAGPTA